jgi:hypothetical protein
MEASYHVARTAGTCLSAGRIASKKNRLAIKRNGFFYFSEISFPFSSKK